MSVPKQIHIVGAGIGGLTFAVAAARAGMQVNLYEQSASLGDVGAGITIGPNASRVFEALGMGDALRAHGHTPRHAGVMEFREGKTLSVKERGDLYIEEFGAPFFHIHRADLLSILSEAIYSHSNLELHTNHRLDAVTQDGERAQLQFGNGVELESELVVAADGLKSPIRAQLFSDTNPQFTGYVAWRGLVPRALLPDYEPIPDFAVYVGPGMMFGRYTVRQASLVNYVAIASQHEWREEGWMQASHVSTVSAIFSDWCEPVREIIAATPSDRCFKFALHVREPLDHWQAGPVVLMGDAAHPMTPFLGLGAGIAIEDAMVLSRCLSAAESTDEALKRYQAARVEHANRAQRESANQGLELLSPSEGGPNPRLFGENALGLYNYDANTVPI